MNRLLSNAVGGVAALIVCQAAAVAQEAHETSAPNEHCVIDACHPDDDCKTAFDLGGVIFNADAGHEFLFRISDPWKISPEHYKIDGLKFTGESYLIATIVTIDINRTTQHLEIEIARHGSGVSSREVRATGSCRSVATIPVFF